ncbi:MAG: cobalt-precorrin-6A reductase [Hyphomicrobiaceae bacterium]
MSPRTAIKRVLILGGTTEARELAAELAKDRRWSIISSLAGRTRAPAHIAGDVRIGGFGGPSGLADFIRADNVDVIIDATHPYADTISDNARTAARATGCRYLRLCRPPWHPVSGDTWLDAADNEAAARIIKTGATALLTIGHKGLGPFIARRDIRLIARMIEPMEGRAPDHVDIILKRPPFWLEDELALMRDRQVDTLVTKNAGGSMVAAKLAAARTLGLPVIMIARPQNQPHCDATTVSQTIALLNHEDT